MTERERFEAWAITFGWDITKGWASRHSGYDPDSYASNMTQAGWLAWQPASDHTLLREAKALFDKASSAIYDHHPGTEVDCEFCRTYNEVEDFIVELNKALA